MVLRAENICPALFGDCFSFPMDLFLSFRLMCCHFPDRKPFPWTEELPLPEPRDWESEEQRHVAGFLADKLVSPALRPYVQPDTPSWWPCRDFNILSKSRMRHFRFRVSQTARHFSSSSTGHDSARILSVRS